MHRLALPLLFLASLAQSAEMEAPIRSVTLYPGTATVERTATVASGAKRLLISGLPGNFDPKTLQVRGDKGIRIGQIVLQEAPGTEALPPREKALRKTIQELKDRIEALDIEAKSAALATAYLGRLDKGVAGNPDAHSLRHTAEGIENAARAAFLRAQQAEIRKRSIREELEAAEFELSRIQVGTRSFRRLSIQMTAESGGQVRLSYQVRRAGWQPAYTAALDSVQSTIDLERLAWISQKTGEDWTDITLRLSTGRPQAFREPIDPQTRRLVYHRPQAAERPRALAAAPMPLLARMNEAKAEAGEDDVAPVIESSSGYATVFEVPGRVTLPADGREISVSLGRQVFSARQRVQVTPAIDRSPVLIAEFEHAQGIWLPGNIQLFRDGDHIGSTRWNPAGDEPFALGFGQDDLLNVSVDRKTQQDGSSGFGGQRAQRRIGDTYTLTSRHRAPIDVQVLEPSPVAQSEEIEIERSFQPLPQGEAWKNRPGIVYWNKRLAPEEKWAIDVAYTITYPKEGSVSGLP